MTTRPVPAPPARGAGARRALRAGALALAALAALLPAAPRDAAAQTSAAIAGVENLGRVTPTYLRGGDVSPEGLEALKAMGVRTVVDLRDDPDPEEAEAAKRLGLTYYAFPMDGHAAPDPAVLERVLGLVKSATEPIFVHCSGGKHRAGSVCALYRMREQGWTAEQAWAEQQAYGFGPPEEHAELFRYVYGGTPVVKRLGAARAVESSTTRIRAALSARGTTSAAHAGLSPAAKLVDPALVVRRARAAGAAGELRRMDLEIDEKDGSALWKAIFASGTEYRFDAATGRAAGTKQKDADSVASLRRLDRGVTLAAFRRVVASAARASGAGVKEVELKRIAGRALTFFEVELLDGRAVYFNAASGRQIVSF